MKILIGADVVVMESAREAFGSGDAARILGEELRDRMIAADYRILNLEAPLTDIRTPIAKCGPRLAMDCSDAAGLKAMGVDLVTLANNHILDQDVQGLQSTFETLKAHQIAWTGAGKNLQEASAPFILEYEDMKIGIYACAEHEFSIAGENTPGANPFDPLWSLDHIRALKDQCDYVIVLYHGGKEQYRYPSPGLQKVCRRIADKGADLVLCQHSHCIGCEEEWNGSRILYGQGNFLFDRDFETYQTGLLVELELTKTTRTITYLPLRRTGAYVRLAREDDSREILRAFSERSRQILTPGFVNEAYDCCVRKEARWYFGRSLGRRRYILYRLADLFLGKLFRYQCYTERDTLALINTIDCEAHRESYLRILNNRLRK